MILLARGKGKQGTHWIPVSFSKTNQSFRSRTMISRDFHISRNTPASGDRPTTRHPWQEPGILGRKAIADDQSCTCIDTFAVVCRRLDIDWCDRHRRDMCWLQTYAKHARIIFLALRRRSHGSFPPWPNSTAFTYIWTTPEAETREKLTTKKMMSLLPSHRWWKKQRWAAQRQGCDCCCCVAQISIIFFTFQWTKTTCQVWMATWRHLVLCHLVMWYQLQCYRESPLVWCRVTESQLGKQKCETARFSCWVRYRKRLVGLARRHTLVIGVY